AKFGDRVAFLSVYVREAHPGARYPQPATLDEKIAHAQEYQRRDSIRWTIAVDDIDGSFHRSLGPKPNAAYFVDADGYIAFRVLWSNDESGLRQGFAVLLSPDPRSRAGDREARVVPMLRGTGVMDEVLGAAGEPALRDLRREMPPVYALAKLAAAFRPLPPLARVMSVLGVVALSGAAIAWWVVRSPSPSPRSSLRSSGKSQAE